jgi:hypothetical protein
MKRHVGRTSKPLDVVPWARAAQGAQLWHGDEKRPPTEAASKLYLEKCQKYLAKLRWITLRRYRSIRPSRRDQHAQESALKWEKDQPSQDNDPPLFVVFDVDALFLEAGFPPSARSHPNCSFRNNGESSRCPTLVPGDHHKSAWRRRSGGATYFFDNGTGSTGTGSSAPDFSNPTYCAQLPPVSRKAGAW